MVKSPLFAVPVTCLVLGLSYARPALAADYYIAPTGSDANPGTMAQPFATMQKGADTAGPGDTVYIRGGTYAITTPTNAGAGVQFSKSGTSDTNRISYFAYPGETPVFDFSKLVISTTGYTHGFVVTGSWLHFKGLELKNVPENTRSNNALDVVTGGNCIFELLNMHHNSGNGIFVGKGSGGHLILNCDSHDNYDATSAQGEGQNADGFGVHYQTTGAVTTVRGCRSWWNSDDGYDLINQEVPVLIENSWAMGNGYIDSGTARPSAGNGNGFKAGSSQTGVRHTIRESLAWKNVASGFYANHSTGGNDWFNNTSYNNGTQYNMLASPAGDPNTTIVLSGSLVHKMRNNIGFPNKNANMMGVDSANNTWDLGITPAAADFTSIADTGAMGPRQADGSLPNLDFMKLPMGSRMIDKGVDVGLSYAGAAPDLGAFEYGAVAAGGSTGAGGASGGTAGAGGINGGAAGATAASGSGAGGAATGPAGSGGSVDGAGAAGGTATPGTGGAASLSASGSSASNVSGSNGAVAGGADGNQASSTDPSGCGCRTTASAPSTQLSTSLLLLLGAAWRKRRRRSAQSQTL